MASTARSPDLRTRIAASFRAFLHDLFDDYRPERHYMRGPGPKWQEKYGQNHGQNPQPSPAATPLYPDSVPA